MTSVGVMASGVNQTTAILIEDCENYTDAPWVTAGSPGIAAARTGNGFSIPGFSTAIGYDIPSPAQTDTITFGGWFKFAAINPSSTEPLIRFRSDTAATTHTDVRLFQQTSTTGNLTLFRGPGTTPLFSTLPLSLIIVNTWHLIEVQVKLHDTIGFATIRIDGTVRGGVTNVDTKNGGTKTVFDRVSINGHTAGSFLVDDVYIRNDATFGP